MQPPGIFGVHAFATQPPAPIPHLMDVHRAFRECRKMLRLIRVDSLWAKHLPLRDARRTGTARLKGSARLGMGAAQAEDYIRAETEKQRASQPSCIGRLQQHRSPPVLV